jgi:hypothetical protein
MFETLRSRPSVAGAFLLQLVAVPVVVGALSLPVFALHDRIAESLAGPDAAIWDGPGVILLLAVGLVLGRFVGGRIESATPSGLWVWVLPFCMSVADFFSSWFSPSEHAEALSMMLRSSGPHEGVIRAIGTDTTMSLMGYSLDIYLAKRVRRLGECPRGRVPDSRV